jgi:hypothetical protein
MTNEANDNDPRVSETYREIATETVPPALDKKILSMAAATPRPGFGLSRAWFRPIAWAATIGLSLAFVLEMSQLDDAAEPALSNDADAVLEEDGARQQNDVLEKRALADEAIGETTEADHLQPGPIIRSDTAVGAKTSTSPAAAEVAPAEAGASVSEDFAAADMLLLQQAEEQASVRSGPARAVAVNSPAAFASKKEYVSLCDDNARRTAASWYACIDDLRERHLDEAVDQELDALLAQFPDFEVPDGNR